MHATDSKNTALRDRFGRPIDYLRISVTDQCDLRCAYCIPKGFKGFETPQAWLTFDEIVRIVRIFASLGVTKYRLTGGEPLLRKNLVTLVQSIKSIPGVEDLSLSTNATRLKTHALDLRQAGLDRINVSLDSMRGECVEHITGSNSLPKVLEGLRIAKDVGFKQIKINMVLLKGINEQDIADMLEYCMTHHFILRLIETMPVGATGRAMGYVNADNIIHELVKKYSLKPTKKKMGAGPARYWQTLDAQHQIGIISPISQHFCDTCNRIRLSVDGTLYMCLGQDHSFALRPMLREGCSDAQLEQAIKHAIDLKPEKHEFTENPHKIVRFMSMTGG